MKQSLFCGPQLTGVRRSKHKVYAALAVSLFLSPTGLAKFSQNSKSEVIIELMDQSGMQSFIQQLPITLRGALHNNPQINQSMSLEQKRQFVDQALEAYTPQILLKSIHRSMKQRLSRRYLRSLRDWYHSSLGKQFSHAEAQSRKTENAMQMSSFSQQEQNDSLQRDRVLQAIENALGVSQRVIGLQTSTLQGILQGSNRASQPSKRLKERKILKLVKHFEDKTGPEIKRASLLSLRFTYRDFTDKQLERYQQFLQTPAAQKFHNSYNQSLIHAFKRASQKLGEDLGRSLATQGKKTPQNTH